MKIFHTVKELKEFVANTRRLGKSIGFVPTMGALHEGHLSLVTEAKRENQKVVLSIFVNPLQFGANEDLDKYPRTLDSDAKLAEKAGVDLLFAPSVTEMYPPGFETHVEVGSIAQPLCGAFRPGHFRGVATVVNRLFQLVEPTRAYFGQKDIQQCLVIRQMVKDFGTNVELVLCPTKREKDGLALSSRNRYLSASEREEALVLFRCLNTIKEKRRLGEMNTQKLLSFGKEELKKAPHFRLQYLEIRSFPELKDCTQATGAVVVAVAGFLGGTRLIDNFVLE